MMNYILIILSLIIMFIGMYIIKWINGLWTMPMGWLLISCGTIMCVFAILEGSHNNKGNQDGN